MATLPSRHVDSAISTCLNLCDRSGRVSLRTLFPGFNLSRLSFYIRLSLDGDPLCSPLFSELGLEDLSFGLLAGFYLSSMGLDRTGRLIGSCSFQDPEGLFVFCNPIKRFSVNLGKACQI